MNNLRSILLALCTLLGLIANADIESKDKVSIDVRLAKLGGYAIYPNSQKGSVAFIDTQHLVNITNELEEILDYFRHQVPIKINCLKDEQGSAKSLRRKAEADFAIIFINDSEQPPTIIVPEERYAIVNFASYKKNLKLPSDEHIYNRRCARAALKAFALLCGGGGSRYSGHVVAAQTPQELDFANDKLPVDIQDSMKKYLNEAGVTPLRRTIYKRACQEGWAPAPTNEIQQAIWDKVKAEKAQVPTKPIKITPDMKPKGK